MFTLTGLILATALSLWGYVHGGYIRMIIGSLMALVIIKSGIDNYNYIVELNNWIKKNQNELIVFYPTRKEIQESIKSEFLPKIPFKFKEVFYDGPTLVGDIKRSIVIELMNRSDKIRVNEPSIIKIVKDKVEVESLTELMQINKSKINYDSLLKRIERWNECV